MSVLYGQEAPGSPAVYTDLTRLKGAKLRAEIPCGSHLSDDGSVERVKTPFYETFGNAILDRQAVRESNARAYPRRLPIALASGRGVFVRDVEGRVYLDCLAGAGALALGHNHPVVIDSIRQALTDEAPLQTLDLPTPLKDRFTESLFDSLPPIFAEKFKVHFCGPSGADAIEAALKLARTATGRRDVVAFHGAYHGMTQGAMNVTGDTSLKTSFANTLADVHFLPFPSNFRCPFGLGGEAGSRINANYLEALFNDPSNGMLPPAAMVLEVVQGEGGVNPAPDDWLRRVRQITARHGVALILDEVQTGLGRTGKLYAFQHAGVTPDILVLSKAIGGGMPLAVILYRDELDLWRPGAHAGTFRGNQLAFAAGAATLRHVVTHHLDEHAESSGNWLQAALEAVAAQATCIGDVRGRGLMRGVEICAPFCADPPPPPFPEMAKRIQFECLRRGLIVELGGRWNSVVRFLPPLIITRDEIDEIASRFGEAVHASEAALITPQ
jgi:diaminobutyrate-2-oxoglutarate transaminase